MQIVPYFGGKYSFGDIAYLAISEIIHGIPDFRTVRGGI